MLSFTVLVVNREVVEAALVPNTHFPFLLQLYGARCGESSGTFSGQCSWLGTMSEHESIINVVRNNQYGEVS